MCIPLRISISLTGLILAVLYPPPRHHYQRASTLLSFKSVFLFLSLKHDFFGSQSLIFLFFFLFLLPTYPFFFFFLLHPPPNQYCLHLYIIKRQPFIRSKQIFFFRYLTFIYLFFLRCFFFIYFIPSLLTLKFLLFCIFSLVH